MLTIDGGEKKKCTNNGVQINCLIWNKVIRFLCFVHFSSIDVLFFLIRKTAVCCFAPFFFCFYIFFLWKRKFHKWKQFNMKKIAPPKWIHHSRQIWIAKNILFQIKSNQEIPKNTFSACKSFLVSTKSFTAIFPDKWKFEWSRKFVEINSKSKEFAFNQILFEAFHVFLVNNIENEIELRIFIAD